MKRINRPLRFFHWPESDTYRFPAESKTGKFGQIIFSPLAWEAKGLGPGYAGVAVAGGRVYTMGDAEDGCYLVALDEATGRTLWQFKTGSSVNATAITYMHNGRQYVMVVSGRGGSLATRYAADKVPTGGSLWTFALMQ